MYVNIYRTGGYLAPMWRECIPVETLEAAEAQAKRIRRLGYKAITKPLDEHRIIGLPDGWCARCDSATGQCTGRKGCEAGKGDITVGDTVYLKAARVFCGRDGRYRDQPRKGPFKVERVYRCGQHVRAKAISSPRGLGYVDSNITSFEKV